MLSGKELLQINATILAGLFILLTLISIDDTDRLKTDLEELRLEAELFAKEREILDKQKEDLDIIVKENDEKVFLYTQKLNESKNIFENLNSSKNSELVKHDLPYYEDLQEFIKIEYDRIIIKQKEFTPIVEEFNQKMEASNKKGEELRKKAEIIETNADNIDTEKNFFKEPKFWIYFMGGMFGLSAIFSLGASYYENDHVKNHKELIKLSYGSLFGGFGFVVLLSIGILVS